MVVRKEKAKISAETAMERLFPSLMSRENFSYLPAETPHVNYENLVIVFRVIIDPKLFEHRFPYAAGIISKEAMEEMGLNLGTLLGRSMANATGTYKVTGLSEMLLGLLDEMPDEDLDPEVLIRALDPEAETVFVITNENNLYGAAGLLFKDVLETAARKAGGDFYLIPSSIHECLIMPIRDQEDRKRLKGILRQVNEEIVDPDPDTGCIRAGLLGAADIEDFIENVTEIIAGTLEQIAKMRKGYGAPILYHYLASYTARAIGRHASDRDKEIMNILQGEEE